MYILTFVWTKSIFILEKDSKVTQLAENQGFSWISSEGKSGENIEKQQS